MRRVLWTSVFFNFGGALLFAFPDSLGRLAGMPAPAPRVYLGRRAGGVRHRAPPPPGQRGRRSGVLVAALTAPQ